MRFRFSSISKENNKMYCVYLKLLFISCLIHLASSAKLSLRTGPLEPSPDDSAPNDETNDESPPNSLLHEALDLDSPKKKSAPVEDSPPNDSAPDKDSKESGESSTSSPGTFDENQRRSGLALHQIDKFLSLLPYLKKLVDVFGLEVVTESLADLADEVGNSNSGESTTTRNWMADLQRDVKFVVDTFGFKMAQPIIRKLVAEKEKEYNINLDYSVFSDGYSRFNNIELRPLLRQAGSPYDDPRDEPSWLRWLKDYVKSQMKRYGKDSVKKYLDSMVKKVEKENGVVISDINIDQYGDLFVAYRDDPSSPNSHGGGGSKPQTIQFLQMVNLYAKKDNDCDNHKNRAACRQGRSGKHGNHRQRY